MPTVTSALRATKARLGWAADASLFRLGVVLGLVMFLAGCGGGDAPLPPGITATSVVTPGTPTAPGSNQPPTAGFTQAASGLSAGFSGALSSDADGSIASYAWSFGDGTTASGVVVTHVYASSGTYTVTLSVTDNLGASTSAVQRLTVTPLAPLNVSPVASFSSGTNNLTATFDARASLDTDGSIASYAWSFGDGTLATGSTAIHAYAAAGSYTVTLVVLDNLGAAGQQQTQITVSAPTGIDALTPGSMMLLAGDVGGYGGLDGQGGAARFSYPEDIVSDAAGNLYVAETGYANTIRKIDPSGNVTTLAGQYKVGGLNGGTTDGIGQAALLSGPKRLAVNSAGTRLYLMSDGGGNTSIRVIDLASKSVSTFATGLGQGRALLLDSAETIYLVTDNSVLKVSAGSAVTAVVRSFATSLGAPSRVVGTPLGDLFYSSNGKTINKVAADGSQSLVAGNIFGAPPQDGMGSGALFVNIAGLALAPDGTLLVTDGHQIRRITTAGVVTTVAGLSSTPSPYQSLNQPADGPVSAAAFPAPYGVAQTPAGDIMVVEQNYYIEGGAIRKISGGNVTTFAGATGVQGTADGMGAGAGFYNVGGLAFDRANSRLWLRDANKIRTVTLDGRVRTVAGDPTQNPVLGGSASSGFVNGVGAAAKFNGPFGLAMNGTGVVVTDSGNHVLRSVTVDGTVTTFSGTGVTGSSDGAASSARFDTPRGIAADGAGGFVVSDGTRIRNVNSAGAASTRGNFAAAPALNAYSLVVNAAGTAIAPNNNLPTINTVDAAGTLGVLAGQSSSFGVQLDGSGAAAKFSSPWMITQDDSGNLYVADGLNGQYTVRKISSTGTVSTLFGGDVTANYYGTAPPLGTRLGSAPLLASVSGMVWIPGNRLLISTTRGVLAYQIP